MFISSQFWGVNIAGKVMSPHILSRGLTEGVRCESTEDRRWEAMMMMSVTGISKV